MLSLITFWLNNIFEKYLKDAGLSLKMPKSEEEPRDKMKNSIPQIPEPSLVKGSASGQKSKSGSGSPKISTKNIVDE